MVRKIAFTLLAAFPFSFEAKAEAYCFNESVYYLIVKGDDIFFTTSKSCQSWCAVNASWSAEAKKRAYASLLAAKMSERTVAFHFNELTSTCSGAVPTYASPTTILSE
jgi:hypothetical protein